MALCTSAACSGVSARDASNLGCFFAYAQPTPRLKIRRTRENFRNIMCNSWFKYFASYFLAFAPYQTAPCGASWLRAGHVSPIILMLRPTGLLLRQLEGDGNRSGNVYRMAVTGCWTETNLLRDTARFFIKPMAQPVHYVLHHDLA